MKTLNKMQETKIIVYSFIEYRVGGNQKLKFLKNPSQQRCIVLFTLEINVRLIRKLHKYFLLTRKLTTEEYSINI